METKLLCCPLCDQETPYPPTTSGPGMWVIMCSHCFLRVSDNTKAKVILKWNTRAPSPYKALCDEQADALREISATNYHDTGWSCGVAPKHNYTGARIIAEEALAKYDQLTKGGKS